MNSLITVASQEAGQGRTVPGYTIQGGDTRMTHFLWWI